MIVFMPYPSFPHAVECLDRERLGKQRVECLQILSALAATRQGERAGWATHPATLMWRDREAALGVYATLCITEWCKRGYKNTMIPPYGADRRPNPESKFANLMAPEMCAADPPDWLGREDVHSSHRGRLLFKKPEHYGVLGWTDTPRSDKEGYVWP